MRTRRQLLVDGSGLVIAYEKGFFRKYGIDAAVIKGASWAAIRDGLTTGDIHAAHMLIVLGTKKQKRKATR
jgi:nitrate/nitrite transport system substrate-binding protein